MNDLLPRIDERYSINDPIKIDNDHFKVSCVGDERMVLYALHELKNTYEKNGKIKLDDMYYVIVGSTEKKVCLRYLEYNEDVLKKEGE